MMIMSSSSTTRPSSSTLFTISAPSPPPPSPPRLLFITPTAFPKLLRRPKIITSIKSIDVSKEDKDPPAPTEDKEPEPESNLDARRFEEKFAVVNTGIYECRSCGYKYSESAGDPSYPIPPGLPFEKLPEDWRCPTCGASQSFFESKRMEIAGFEQNQQFGLGGNALTSGQKLLLIYGGLLLGFALFLSGYFLQ
ncbi:hypothetical protein SASPL_137958 [Salvia splendens]|uniref:Rubredoxin-like domain-containing protein n=1 Tax=Salvia splendens TaxID=180675 RepID=A0A8X8ZDX9_SALSN|nr:rubredoxin-like [Salvia splendens]KAG6401113.1 hypothetical protein SASPL_137958 [Salvia splendens]